MAQKPIPKPMSKLKAIQPVEKLTGTQAVIKTGGKQYRVREGQTLKVEKILGEFAVGDTVTFDMVLLTDDGSSIVLGTPTISGKNVSATITDIDRAAKVVVGKFKQKSKYFVKNGHRQPFFEVKIGAIK
jgi:large subunit ribosomal protein L21